MYVSIYNIYIYNIYVYMYLYMYIRMFVCLFVCMYVCIYVCMYVYTTSRVARVRVLADGEPTSAGCSGSRVRAPRSLRPYARVA
jgi:hypothetical protein